MARKRFRYGKFPNFWRNDGSSHPESTALGSYPWWNHPSNDGGDANR